MHAFNAGDNLRDCSGYFPFSTSGDQMSSALFSSEVTALNETKVTAREQTAQEQTQIGNLGDKFLKSILIIKTIQDLYFILRNHRAGHRMCSKRDCCPS